MAVQGTFRMHKKDKECAAHKGPLPQNSNGHLVATTRPSKLCGVLRWPKAILKQFASMSRLTPITMTSQRHVFRCREPVQSDALVPSGGATLHQREPTEGHAGPEAAAETHPLHGAPHLTPRRVTRSERQDSEPPQNPKKVPALFSKCRQKRPETVFFLSR